MLDPDISTEDARRLLSSVGGAPERRGPGGWTRRNFLQAIGLGVVGGAAVGTLGEGLFGDLHDAWAGTPIGPSDGILVTIMFYGGNDGLNMFVPYGNGNYYSLRTNLAIPAAQVLKIDAMSGFAPQMGYTKSLYDAGLVAAVQGVGYPNPDLSHFTSMATWMNGRYSGGAPTSGWLGRWLDGQPASTAELAAASLDTSVPLHMVGNTRKALGISENGDMFGTGTSPEDVRMYNGVRAMAATGAGRGPWHDMFASTMRTQVNLATEIAPVFDVDLPPGGELTRKLTMAARLINANIGMRVLDVGRSGFDNHDGENSAHPALMQDFDNGLRAFFSTLSPAYRDRVTIMTMSEFGRTPGSNLSVGTDHGTASTHLVIGSNVQGGLYGQQPSLAKADFDSNGRLRHHVDFRAMYGSVIDGWLGGGASSILDGGFENLNLFRAGPGTPSTAVTPISAPSLVPVTPPATPAIVLPPAEPGGYVPLVPVRVFDSRNSDGGQGHPIGEGETWNFVIVEQFGIPSDATAVALNVTSVDASAPSFVTVWPAGEARPFVANLNPVPGMAVPNLVVARLGVDGAISVFNNTGSVHLVADLIGYFSPSSKVGLTPLTPFRLLDTRDGTGDRTGAIGQGEWIDLQVTERGGVEKDATAVALNVTVTEPTAGSFLTVWPTGDSRPLAASVNMVPGQTVPNMVLARVGHDGKVSIFNNSGSAHVVVDVLGSFGRHGAGRYIPLTPARALDSREGNGAPLARIGQGESISLQLAGRAGVPAAGANAVLLNVTAVTPSAATYVTVYPTGGERPLAANLNAVAGQVVPNMVLARLGPDGCAAIYNNTGDLDLVADVMGYFA